MAINPNLPYRLGFYYRDRDEYYIEQQPLSRQQAIQEVKENYDPYDEDTDVFVAFLPIPSEPECYARDIPATEEAQHFSEDESDGDSQASAANSRPATPHVTPPLPDNPAAQATVFFPVQLNETDSQRQERADAEALFTAYPLTAKDLWRRFHETPMMESTMFDIWETGRRQTQGPEAARDMARANIHRMKHGKAWELKAMEELLDGDA